MMGKSSKTQYKVSVRINRAEGLETGGSDFDRLPTVRLLCRAAIVQAVCDGFLSLEEACERYALSIDEFLELCSEMQNSSYLPADQNISVALPAAGSLGRRSIVQLRHLS